MGKSGLYQCSTLVKKTARPQDGLLSDVVCPDKKLSARTFSVMDCSRPKNKRDTKSNKMSLLVRRRAFQWYMTCLCWVTLLPQSYPSCRAGWIHTNFCPPRAEGWSLFRTLVIPDSATSSTDTPCSWAMNPRTLKMTNPAYSDVKLFIPAINTQSL